MPPPCFLVVKPLRDESGRIVSTTVAAPFESVQPHYFRKIPAEFDPYWDFYLRSHRGEWVQPSPQKQVLRSPDGTTYLLLGQMNDRPASSGYVLERVRQCLESESGSKRLHLATRDELVTFGNLFPSVPREWPVVALGKRQKRSRVPYLYFFESAHKKDDGTNWVKYEGIQDGSYNHYWDTDCVFLLVGSASEKSAAKTP